MSITVHPLLTPDESIDIVLAHLRGYSGDKLCELKNSLEKFNRHTFQWRG